MVTMKTSLSHIGINLSSEEKCFVFWQDLLKYLEFDLMLDGNHFDASDGHTFLCFSTTKSGNREPAFHRKRTGLNHIAFSVSSREEVDQFVKEYLRPRHIAVLYEGAKEYDYVPGYYAVYFEDPDRIKIEIAFAGEK